MGTSSARAGKSNCIEPTFVQLLAKGVKGKGLLRGVGVENTGVTCVLTLWLQGKGGRRLQSFDDIRVSQGDTLDNFLETVKEFTKKIMSSIHLHQMNQVKYHPRNS